MSSLPEKPDDSDITPASGRIRASDAEREQIVQLLSDHATTGRLTLAELEERIGIAYQAKTRDELARLTSDLPDVHTASTPPAQPSTRKITRWLVAVMGGSEKKGRWRADERLNAVAVMGGHTIDLRDAELSSEETTIVSVNIMGGTDIFVPDTVDVDIGGFSIMGGTGEHGSTRPPRPGAPRIRILVYNVMGGSDVWRLPEEAKGLRLKEAKKLAKRARP